MNKFEVGDVVRVIAEGYRDFGVIGRIQRIETGLRRGYKVENGYWHAASELAPQEPTTPETAADGGDYVPCVGDPVDMFVKGWLDSPLTSMYSGRRIGVSHHQKNGNYKVTVNGDIVASVSEAWFYRTMAEGYRLTTEAQATELARREQRIRELTAADAGWEQAGAYSHKMGAIQWEDGYTAIKQLAESAAGKEDQSRFMHETLNAIHAIAAQEIENRKAAQAAKPEADGGSEDA